MRVAEVIGTVTLARRLEGLASGRLLIAQPLPLVGLAGGVASATEPLVAYDELSAGLGARVGLSEGREAAMPFHPRPVPIDVYCAALLDDVQTAQGVEGMVAGHTDSTGRGPRTRSA